MKLHPPQRTTGETPTKCSGAAACVLDDAMYVVAGFHRCGGLLLTTGILCSQRQASGPHMKPRPQGAGQREGAAAPDEEGPGLQP